MQQLGVKNDIAKLQQLLGSKLYSNKYSFISEALQNSTDAMRKCGKQDEHFDVGIKKDGDDFFFYVRDYGCSFDSIEDFQNKMTLLESSKTQVKDGSENQELGKYGIGSISVAAYQKEWNYKIYKNNQGFDVKLQEIDGKGLFMDCKDYYTTEEKDGVYFEVKIDKLDDFVKNMFFKAKYFQNIKFYFDLNSIESLRYDYNKEYLITLNEKFIIYKSEDFQYSTLNTNDTLHICIDQYTYDINWNEVGISAIKLPFALKFNLNEFETNPTREVLTIDENYKDKIINKIKKVSEWLINRYNEENPIFEAKSLRQFQEELNKRKNKIITIADKNIDIENICKTFTTIKFNNPTFKEISQETLKDFTKFLDKNWRNFYELKCKIRYNKTSRPNYSVITTENSYLIEKSLKKIHQLYFKQIQNQGQEHQFFVKNPIKFVLTNEEITGKDISYQNYKEIESEDLDVHHENLYKQFLILKNEWEESIFLRVENVVPVDFVNTQPKKERVKKEKVEKSEEEIFLKYPRRPEKSTQWFAVWEDKPVKIKNLSKLPKLHIYGTEVNRRKIEQVYSNLQTNNLQCIMVSERNEKLIKEKNPQNFIHILELKEKFTEISKYITASYIHNKVKDNKVLFDYNDIINKYISTSIAKDFIELKEILKTYDVEDVFYKKDSSFLGEIVQLYKDNPKMYNMDMIYKYEKVKINLEKLDFVDLFASSLREIDSRYDKNKIKAELALKTMRELCRAKSVRMNWQNYKLDKIEEFYCPVVLEEQLELEEV